MAVQIQMRRDTASNWTTNDPTLAAGEWGLETDTSKFKIGNGSTAWSSLAYSSLPSNVLPLAGGAMTGAITTNSTFTIACSRFAFKKFFVFHLLGLLFPLQGHFFDAHLSQPKHRIAFLPAIRFFKLLEPFNTCKHVAFTNARGIDFQALVDGHRFLSPGGRAHSWISNFLV